MVYTNENAFIVGNARNILESQGFRIFVKNEHAASIIGEVSAFDSWVELWVIDDCDYEPARKLLESTFQNSNQPPWTCDKCGENNDPSFEFCWNCRHENL